MSDAECQTSVSTSINDVSDNSEGNQNGQNEPDLKKNNNIQSEAVKEIFNKILKSRLDESEYRGMILKNGLRVMMVSDKRSHRSAVCMNVNVGSWFDSRELPGLARFVENQLYSGTEKYPDRNDYFDFISLHGGSESSCTSSIHTSFYFDIDENFLKPALDRFIRFFISPTFDPENMENGLNSIQADFQRSFTDRTKYLCVAQETCNQSHDFSKFVGNRDTLKDVDVGQLRKFYNDHYSANVMNLCVLGKASLDELQAMVTELPINEIKNKNIKPKLRSMLLATDKFHREHLAKEIKIVPSKDYHQLIIDFHPHDLNDSLNEKDRLDSLDAQDYIAYVFNQKGEGSILTELKRDRRNLVITIGMFATTVGAILPKESVAEEKVDEIIKTVLQFFNFVKRDGIQQWVSDESWKICDIADNHDENENSLDKVIAIALNMQTEEIEDVLQTRDCSSQNFRPELIKQILEQLKPENMRITLLSKAFEGKTDRLEKWYGVKYSYEDIAEERMACWRNAGFNENLKLHRPNEYVPINLELVEQEEVEHPVPQLIKRDEFSHVWFLQELKTPRAFYGVHLKNPFLHLDVAAVILITIYCELLKKSLEESASQAAKAGIFYQITVRFDGLLIEVHGFSEKLPVFLSKIVDKLAKFEFSREHFEKFKGFKERAWKDHYKQPLSVLLYSSLTSLHLEQFSAEDILASLPLVTFEKLQKVAKRFFSRFFINLFVYGNVTRKDVELVERMTKQRLIDVYGTSTVFRSAFLMKRPAKLPDHSSFIYQLNSKEPHQNGLLQFYQIGPESPAEKAKIDLMVKLLDERFYFQMRKQKLSTLARIDRRNDFFVLGLSFFVPSSYELQHLDDRIEEFIGWAAGYLKELGDEDFDAHKKSLKLKYSEPFRTFNLKSRNFFLQIVNETRVFNESELKLEALEKVTKEQIIDLFDEHLVRNQRKISIRITGEAKASEPAVNDPIRPHSGAESSDAETIDVVSNNISSEEIDVESKDAQSKSEPKVAGNEGSSETSGLRGDTANGKKRKSTIMITDIRKFRDSLEEYPCPGSFLLNCEKA